MRTPLLAALAALAGGIVGGATMLALGSPGGGRTGPGWMAPLQVLLPAVLAALAAALVVERRVRAPLESILRSLQAPTAGRGKSGLLARGATEIESLGDALLRFRVGVDDEARGTEGERQRLFRILEGMPVGILALDGRGRITLVNEAGREILGIREDPLGRTPVEAVRSGELQAAVDAVLRDPGARTLEFTRADPSRRRVTAHLFPVEAGVVAVIQDVTRMHRLEEARRDMVANIGHELRTPLSAILGYLETMEQSPDLAAEDRARFLGIISRNSRRLERLVKDLSQLSRLESDAFEPRREVLDLAAAARVALEALSPRAAAKAIDLRVELPPELPRLSADRGALEAVLLNLLDNAVRAAPPGGRVRLAARGEGERVRIWVEDNGPGVPRELRDRVFERFYRLDFGRSAEEGGTGLGLAIVKHAVLQHDGEVGVQEAEGGGAHFWFTLPAAPAGTPVSSS